MYLISLLCIQYGAKIHVNSIAWIACGMYLEVNTAQQLVPLCFPCPS